jgi:hypothetical protein
LAEGEATQHSGSESTSALTRTVLAALALVAGWRLVLTVLEAPRHTFAETRLMPLFLALGGQSPYAMPGDGACYVPMYPPLSLLLYAPIALFGDPLNVLRAGTALTLVAALLPFALFLPLAAPGREAMQRRVLAFAAFVFLLHLSPVLVSATFIHADTPAIAVAAVGVFLVVLASRRNSSALLTLSTFVLSLVPWTKHTLLAIVLLPFLATASRGRWKSAAAQLALGAGLQAAWAGLLAIAFGERNLLFWLFEFPGRHPWIGKPLEVFALSNRVLLSIVLVDLAVLVGAGIALGNGDALWKRWSERPWATLLVTALLLWPSSLIGYFKVGGAVNSFLPTVYFSSCAVLLLLVDDATWGGPVLPSRLGAGVLLFVAAVLGAQTTLEAGLGTRTVLRETFETSVAYETLRTSPNQFLFPWFPMSTYLATGRFTHSELGIRERELAGIAVPPEQVRRFVPDGLRYVICGREPCGSTLGHFGVVKQRPISTPSGRWLVCEVGAHAPR